MNHGPALLLSILTTAGGADGPNWVLRSRKDPQGVSWVPLKCCVPPAPFVLAGFVKIHCISLCRRPWGEQLPHSGVFFVNPLKYICAFISEGRKCLLTFTSLQALWGLDF